MLTRRLIDPYIQKIRLPRQTSVPRLPDLPYVPSLPPPTLLCCSYLSSVTYGGLERHVTLLGPPAGIL
ncbi:hypothetical protein L249_6052 [Ophiocordyceps polyrhachis-furcata BCC 54312]|uniref:Uncharacterized protein n=1 Tax=Ophiocordyceps polyrhachis-furcata BCC 54312 TaxID=1330021 RepID=A0A367LI87_9HYPO|nr:hypothetical protein L249_6052 [Ophiocordyceps polyrhachis-furcata BCC 54312]